jgi:hypothetical protein
MQFSWKSRRSSARDDADDDPALIAPRRHRVASDSADFTQLCLAFKHYVEYSLDLKL